MPKFGSHVLLISEDFIKQDPNNAEKCILHFYSDRDVILTKKVILANGEVVYPSVKTTPYILRDTVADKIIQEPVRKFDEKTIETLKGNVSAVDYLKEIYGFTFQPAGRNYVKCD